MLSANFKLKMNSCGIARFPCDSMAFLLTKQWAVLDIHAGRFGPWDVLV